MKTHSLLLAAAFGLCVLGAETTLAHVTLEQREAAVGGPYKATFRVPHGCKTSPTPKVRVRIPDGVIGVKPMPKAGWQLDIVKAKYDKPYKMFHSTVTEGAREVTWTGRLTDDNYDEFVLSVYLTDELKPDGMLYFRWCRSARPACTAGSRFPRPESPPRISRSRRPA